MEQQYNVGIIQMTRIGDLIQTSIAASVLKRENPTAKLTLICREKFGKNIEFILRKTFDDIIYISPKRFFSADHEHLSNVKEKLKLFLNKCNQNHFDFLL